jgi:hypothetical protein
MCWDECNTTREMPRRSEVRDALLAASSNGDR